MLVWPQESVLSDAGLPQWHQAGSNLCLDFHGDPQRAKLVVLSDGNHHMALHEAIQDFMKRHSGADSIFYATTPPGPLLSLIKHGGLEIGNLVLSVTPHVLLSPPAVLERLISAGRVREHVPFMRSQGSVLLVKKGNPRHIRTVADLAGPDVRLFLSNPHTESVSYQGYVKTLLGMAAWVNADLSFLNENQASDKIVYGERIHHREAPQCVADGRADVAIVYYHLGLRYTRIFPGEFELVSLPEPAGETTPDTENVISQIHAGLLGDGGPWGEKFLAYLRSESAAAIYVRHGLLPLPI